MSDPITTGPRRTGEELPSRGGSAAERIAALFAIDLRSLALFRIALASAVLFDLADRARDLAAHYTADGVLPPDAAAASLGALHQLVPHSWFGGSVAGQGALFALAAGAGALLLVGLWTRVATLASWVLLVSLQARNPYVAGMGGDSLVRILLFWGLFLPLGARGSVDAWRRGELRGSGRTASVASAALLLQMAFFYVATGLHKAGPLWRDGSAVHYALHIDYWATAFGVWLREQTALVVAATHGTRAFEIMGPLLAFSPWRTAELRVVAIAAFALFHLVLAAALDIGPFPIFSMVGWMAFVPSRAWDEWLPGLGARIGVRAVPPSETAPVVVRPSRLAQAVVGGLLAYVVCFLGVDLGRNVYAWEIELPRGVTAVGGALRLNQRWRMFAPDPPRGDVWIAPVGRLADGRRVDPLRNAPPLTEKPKLLSASYPSFRWRLYLWSMRTDRPGEELLRAALVDWLCRSWRDRHPSEPLLEVELVRMLEPSPPSDATLREESLYTGRCESPVLANEDAG